MARKTMASLETEMKALRAKIYQLEETNDALQRKLDVVCDSDGESPGALRKMIADQDWKLHQAQKLIESHEERIDQLCGELRDAETSAHRREIDADEQVMLAHREATCTALRISLIEYEVMIDKGRIDAWI
jgi:predicted RNase H-like nuclease (RuvC/YqgF family)